MTQQPVVEVSLQTQKEITHVFHRLSEPECGDPSTTMWSQTWLSCRGGYTDLACTYTRPRECPNMVSSGFYTWCYNYF